MMQGMRLKTSPQHGRGSSGALTASSLALAALLQFGTPSAPALAVQEDQVAVAPTATLVERAPPCKPQSPCVSTSSFRSPAQYVAPWLTAPDTVETAARNLAHALQEMGATDVQLIEKGQKLANIRAHVPFQGLAGEEVDEMQFILRDGVVLFRSMGVPGETSAVIPDPPACFTPGCISGPRQRSHVEAVRANLGWPEAEVGGEQERKWVPILFH